MVLIIVQTVMNGFSHEITKAMKDLNGDIRIEGEAFIQDYPLLLDLIERQRFVKVASPYAYGMVMVQHGNIPTFPQVRGMDLSRERDVLAIDEFLIQGALANLDDESVFLSSGLANTLGASIDSTVDLYTPLMLYRMKENDVLLPRELTVAGIFETGWSRVDGNSMITSLRLMQELYGMGDSVHGISVMLKNGEDLNDAVQELNFQLPENLHAYPWTESDRDLLFILNLEKTVMFFIILFIILVASFSIASTLMASVVRKTREIGLLGAIGGQPWQCAACFCLQGLFIGFVGTFLGIVLGILAVSYRNAIVQWFAHLTHSEAAFQMYYEFSDIPAVYMTGDFVKVIIATLIISTLAGLLPALRAARMKPSEALRNE